MFHEQILKTFDVMTGCGLARADEFRRALGNEVLEARVEEFFRKEARARGYSPEVVDKVWGTLKAFGSFGFCKAHGAAFAVPTYQSAWLKTHHPEAFLAGLWEHDPGMYPKRLLVAEARRLGIPILPLDINRSQAEYRVERVAAGPDRGKLGIRLSLNGIYGLSGAELKRIVAGQPYDSLADLRARSRLSKPSIQRLAQLGAFDSLHRASGGAANRADLVQHLQTLQSRPHRKGIDVIEGQLSLPLGDVELRNLKAGLPAPTLVDTVRAELDLMAVDVSDHLMASHRPAAGPAGRHHRGQAAGAAQRHRGAGGRGPGRHPDPAHAGRPARGVHQHRRRHGLRGLRLLPRSPGAGRSAAVRHPAAADPGHHPADRAAGDQHQRQHGLGPEPHRRPCRSRSRPPASRTTRNPSRRDPLDGISRNLAITGLGRLSLARWLASSETDSMDEAGCGPRTPQATKP